MSAHPVEASTVPVTLSDLLDAASSALGEAGLTEARYVEADVVSVRRLASGLVVGELGSAGLVVPFVCRWPAVDRALASVGAGWERGVSAVWVAGLDLHPRFGLRVGVFGVRSESVGRAASDRLHLELVARVRREGWASAQGSVSDPGLPVRVGVVAAPDTQGLDDFVRLVGSVCEVRIFEAAMSGVDAADSVVEAIARAGGECDVVVLARGGGAGSGMGWADTEQVVRAVVACPVQVWVAVGHASDRHLVDAVAARSFATPSHAAAELRRRAEEVVRAGREAELVHERESARRGEAIAVARARRTVLAVVAITFAVVVVAVVRWMWGVVG